MLSTSGGDLPDPLTRGFAPGPHWGLRPQTPVIGSRSRARHERQPPGSFFVRTGSLQRSLVTSQPSDSRSSEMSNNNVSAGHAALRGRCRLSLLVQLTIKKYRKRQNGPYGKLRNFLGKKYKLATKHIIFPIPLRFLNLSPHYFFTHLATPGCFLTKLRTKL